MNNDFDDFDLNFKKLPPEVYKGFVVQWIAERIHAFAIFLISKTSPYVSMYSAEFGFEDDDSDLL